MLNGYIPEKIVYICKAEKTITPHFGDTNEEFFKTAAKPAFPVDPNKTATVETARSWATRYNYNEEVNTQPIEIEMSNEPIYEVQLVDLEIRAEGGRAYKAIVHGSFLVDIREDVMLEAMLVKGVRQGTFIASSFIWARVGSQMKLVRVGSSLHADIKAAHERRQQPKISSKQLKAGKIYNSQRGKTLFLGFVKTASLNVSDKYRKQLFTNTKYKVVTKNRATKMQLWFEILFDHDKINTVQELLANIEQRAWALQLKKSATVYDCNDECIAAILPQHFRKIKNIILDYHDIDPQHLTASEHDLLNFQYIVMNEYPKDLDFVGNSKALWDSYEYR